MSKLQVGFDRPYQSVEHAIANAVAGDTIEIEFGRVHAKLLVTATATRKPTSQDVHQIDTAIPAPLAWDTLAAPQPTWTLSVTGAPGTISLVGTIGRTT